MAESRKPIVKRPKNIKRPAPVTPTRQEYPRDAKSPRQAANEVGVSHGRLYVRMLNCSGIVVPVIADLVCDRMQDGYRFIDGEPCVPRLHGNPRECDAKRDNPSFHPYPRQQPHPGNTAEAIRIWYQFSQRDRAAFSDTHGLMWDFVTNLSGRVIDRNPFAAHMDPQHPDVNTNTHIRR